jgi:chromosome segregation ATPase
LRLNGQQELYDIYLDEKYYLRSVLKLYRLLKREGMAAATDNNNIEWFVNMVKTGTYKIPEIQKQYSKAKDELEVIEYKRVVSKHALDKMNNQIILLRRSMYQLSATCNNKRNEIAYLQNQIQVLEGHINGITNRNQQQQQQEEIQNESYT